MTELPALEDRSVHAWHQDGLGECTLGLIFGALGLGALVARLPSPITTPFPFVWIFLPAVIVGALAKRALPGWKATVTVSRTGYVEPRPAGRAGLAVVTLFTMFAIAALATQRSLNGTPTDIVVIMSGLLTAAFAYGAVRWSMPHFLAFAAMAAAFAVWAHRTQASPAVLSWLLLALGLALVIGGVLRLRMFLASHPIQHERPS